MFSRARGHGRAAEHPCDLLDAGRIVQAFEPRMGPPGLAELRHPNLVLRLGGDLRKMRDTQHLRLRCKLREQVTDPGSHRATDACIDLIEDEAGQVAALQRRHLEREADPGQLATGRDLRERPGRLSGVCADQEFDLIVAGFAELGRVVRVDPRNEFTAAHAELLQQASDAAIELRRELATGPGQLRGVLDVVATRRFKTRVELGAAFRDVAQLP